MRNHFILRGLGILFVVVLVLFTTVFFFAYFTGGDPRVLSLFSGDGVGVLQIDGAIDDSHEVLAEMKRLKEMPWVKAIVVRIDSPGGAVGPSQEIHDEVVKLAKKKTVVCSLGNLAASGGFYIAVACPKIVSAPGTLTGSIGVISQFPNVKGLAERFSFKMETVKSGKLKDAGNPFRDMTPEDRAYWQSLIDRVYGQFLAAVVEGRGLDEADVRKVADGRVITGAEAKDLGLVDALGNFYDAVDLAKKEAKLSGEPHLVYPPDERSRFLEELIGGTAGAVADALHARLSRDAQAAQAPGLYFLAR